MILADLLTSVGRLHPLIVHLPIGALVLAFLLDLISWRSKSDFSFEIRILLLIGFVSATIACVCGYLLSLSVDYDTELVDRHMYSGIAVAIISGVLYWISKGSLKVAHTTMTVALVASMGLLTYGGHQGGMLTYGPDFLSYEAYVEKRDRPPVVTQLVSENDSLLSTVNPDIPDSLDMALVEKLRGKGVVVRVMLQRPVMLDVTIMPGSQVAVNEITDDLIAIAPNVLLFNAADNNLNAADLEFLRSFGNLEKLRLERNPLGDDVVDYLLDLKHLEAVNLYNTNVTSAGVAKLKTSPSIKRIYVWGTKAE
jgi:uncharacterized membrane protein